MAEVTSYNAARIQEIEDAGVVSGSVDSNGNLVLHLHGGGSLTVGSVVAPAGTVIMSAASIAPSGWLLCNGAEISRSTYQGLFDAIGTAYGSGNGTSTFNIPNLEAKFPRMQAAARGGTGGQTQHTHAVTVAAHAHNLNGGTPAGHARVMFSGSANPNFWERQITTTGYAATVAAQIPSAVSNTDTKNLAAELAGNTDTTSLSPSTADATGVIPPYVNLNFLIKT